MAILLGHWLDPHGGFHSLSNARGWDTIERDFSNSAWPGAIAGDLLIWVVRLAYWAPPASISKAFHLEKVYLQHAYDRKGERGAHSKRSIIEAWTKYRPAVSLWAALRSWQFYYGDTTGHGPDRDGPDWCSPFKQEGICGFLAHAEIFRRICVSLHAHGQFQPILDPERLGWYQKSCNSPICPWQFPP